MNQDRERLPVPKAFALTLETACEDFEILSALIEQRLKIEAHPVALTTITLSAQVRAGPRIQMALAKSFIFNSVRAYRICEHGAGSLSLPRGERKLFLSAAGCLVPVRNVNEHGFDANVDPHTTPSFHVHKLEEVLVDETALAILGPDKILMGPLNLSNVYPAIDRMRNVAGFAALHRSGTGPTGAVP